MTCHTRNEALPVSPVMDVLLQGGRVTNSVATLSQPNATASPAAAQPSASGATPQHRQDLVNAQLQIETLTGADHARCSGSLLGRINVQ